jgi:hypothetical protein
LDRRDFRRARERAGHWDRARLSVSALDLVSEVLHRVANLPPGATERLLNIALGLVRHTLVVQALVIGHVANGLLDLALDLVGLAFEFVTIHVLASSREKLQESVRDPVEVKREIAPEFDVVQLGSSTAGLAVITYTSLE